MGKGCANERTSDEIAKGGRYKGHADIWGLGVHRASKRAVRVASSVAVRVAYSLGGDWAGRRSGLGSLSLAGLACPSLRPSASVLIDPDCCGVLVIVLI